MSDVFNYLRDAVDNFMQHQVTATKPAMTALQALVDEADRGAVEIERLRHEVDALTNCGVIECAVRNPSVAEYMRHWEGRATKAEAEIERLRRALHDIAEEWAGAECGEPVYAQEAYAIGLAKRMYSLAAEALGRKS